MALVVGKAGGIPSNPALINCVRAVRESSSSAISYIDGTKVWGVPPDVAGGGRDEELELVPPVARVGKKRVRLKRDEVGQEWVSMFSQTGSRVWEFVVTYSSAKEKMS